VARAKKPHSIAESLIKPCAIEIVKLVCSKNEYKKLLNIPLSNDVIRDRIVEISDNILKRVIKEIKNSPVPISIQLDETTDISQCSHLMIFARYINNNKIKE